MEFYGENECVFCNNILDSEETVTLGEKGVKGIEKAAEERKERVTGKTGQKVHSKCKKQYTNPRILSVLKRKEDCEPEKVCLRS